MKSDRYAVAVCVIQLNVITAQGRKEARPGRQKEVTRVFHRHLVNQVVPTPLLLHLSQTSRFPSEGMGSALHPGSSSRYHQANLAPPWGISHSNLMPLTWHCFIIS